MNPIQDSIETYRVGLILTEQCNLSCSHCWFKSGPDKTLRMGVDEALGYIDQAREIPTVKWISLSGGEPFLFQEMLQGVISYASKQGLRTECVTNCFWAESEKKAATVLRKLQQAGLDVINISADDFHQDQLPFERVLNCYRASQRLGMKTVIMCTVTRSSMLTASRVVSRLGDKGILILRGKVPPRIPASALAIESGCVPVGRAAQIPENERVIGAVSIEGPCRVVLHDVSIAPSGRVSPCCSALGTNEAFMIGNARRERLRAIIQKAGYIGPFKLLMGVGPGYLQKWTRGKCRKGYVNKCHLCYAVMTDPLIKRWSRMENLPAAPELKGQKL